MGWGNCEDHYSRVAKDKEKLKPMDTKTKWKIIGWSTFSISVLWLLLK